MANKPKQTGPVIHVPQEPKAVRISREDDRVKVFIDGELVHDLHYQNAMQLGKALIIKGREAETLANLDGIVLDSAAMLRSGAPFTLAPNDPRILEEVKKEAAYNTQLRKHVPLKGIRSQEVVGTPTLKQQPPKKEPKNGKGH